MDIKIDKDQMTFQLMEIAYFNMLGIDDVKEGLNMMPNGWNASDNYKKKINVLAEAIDKNINILDTELYKKETEGKIID